MNLQLNAHISPRSDDALLADLVNTAKRLKKNTINYKQYKDAGTFYPTIFTRRFGSWNNALHRAGLQVTKQYNITIPELFENLFTLWQKLGRQPALSDLYRPLSRFGRKPYQRAFGSWSKALKSFTKKVNNTPADKLAAYLNTALPTSVKHKSKTPSANITWRVRHLVMKRDHFRCILCGASTALDPCVTLHIDHIIPVSKGGTSSTENLRTLCARCNIGKSDL